MKIEKLILSDFKTNCYIISDNGIAIIVDPASNGENIDLFLKNRNYQLKAIFLTHGHQDQIGACDYLYNIYKCDIYAHINDRDLIVGTDPSKILTIPSLKNVKVTAPVKYFDDEFVSFNIDGIIIDAILTPGHSDGSVTYVLRQFCRIFSGDTVIKDGIGDTNYPTYDATKLKESIEIYKTFKDTCKLNPAHGPASTIGDEKANNQYFKY